MGAWLQRVRTRRRHDARHCQPPVYFSRTPEKSPIFLASTALKSWRPRPVLWSDAGLISGVHMLFKPDTTDSLPINYLNYLTDGYHTEKHTNTATNTHGSCQCSSTASTSHPRPRCHHDRRKFRDHHPTPSLSHAPRRHHLCCAQRNRLQKDQ